MNSMYVRAPLFSTDRLHVQMHKQTGTMLQATLRYHMDDTDRGNFTLIAKTDAGLPYELRDGLDYELKRWIKTKYNKAYIAFMISQGIKNPFNPEQTAKLWYWWQGSVGS